MNEIYQLLLERNARETTPFVSIYESNATLLNQVDALQTKCQLAERQVARLEEQRIDSDASLPVNSAATAALKNEKRLREKLEKLQQELNTKIQTESNERAVALQTTQDLSRFKDLNTAQEQTIGNLKQENERAERAIEHLTNQLDSAQSDTKLAEQQYDGLKRTIRVLQEENDALKKENRDLESRLVSDKGKLVEEMNVLTEMVDALKKEVNMLRSYQAQENKRRSWFGGSGSKAEKKDAKNEKVEDSPKWGSFGVVVPSSQKQSVAAHAVEGTCLRYDGSGSDLLATSSSDSTVKVWDANTGTVRATLRGTSGHSIMSCDLSGSLVVGAGSDKTCRVWNVRTERMMHHLVGHQHKITCTRLISQRAVITGSADRSMKVWDISRTTYRQTTTLRHSSTSNCIDVGSDSYTAVSGHLDGGLRFWDLRTGERTSDITDMHEAGITSVHFNPSNELQVLTNSLDSSLKLVDLRTGTAIHTLRHQDFTTSHSWSRSVLSPDGKYAAAGSNSNGTIFIWKMQDGSLKTKLTGHKTGVCGIDWSRGGTSGQQVATIDRKGTLILWA